MSNSSDDDIPLKQRVAKKKSASKKPVKEKAPKNPKKEAPKPKASPKAKAAPRARSKKVGKERSLEEEENLLPNDARKYFKQGQKFITPPNGDGTRGFYESLFEENRNSLVALRYLVEWGVLTGTLLHESLPRYFALKDKGAFKGAGGGLQKAFMNGPDPADVSAAAKMLNASSGNNLQ
ncbi:hypothetical protein, conserved [Eimeria tenella]|uniref:Uncharacterized protein n=1 Tax=Eimeria tenella TaxID=5802 RepID=H9B9J2_EIMTE|nr:hypothetical protein, conserved [Eimeria tenella]AET50652.1 hypothetical protein [Eimeria tenella]CDJ43208.1 hypothetical protein, conserved [Eimeria tenella]|eukprot:XP_013233958.1 hypothetical protein, conserved [Eimeria tenella]